MPEILLAVAVLIPLVGGVAVPLFKAGSTRLMHAYVLVLSIATSVLVWMLILNRPETEMDIVHFTKSLTISFKLDGLGSAFAGLVASLWPFVVLYSFKYMEHEGGERSFFAFFTMTYGVTLGIAFAEDLMTLYFFYEALTLVTLPLVLHGFSRRSVAAGRKYLYFSLGGAAFAFIGLIFIISYGTPDFAFGGSVDWSAVPENRVWLMQLVYVLCFCGFGVKAAIFPVHSWLPEASVAPTPVTALLHAVAVVKAGAFAVVRMTYYNFGTAQLAGTWAQYVVLGLAAFTIVFGSASALSELHLKRRLAFSTVANLSYILFAAALMSESGLLAALLHMIAHGVTKICAFLCVGAVMVTTGREYVYDIHGFGRKMPIVFGCFTVSALSLTGIPLFGGFISKWYIAEAAFAGGWMGWIGLGALLVSALLTAVYMFSVVVRAFFPPQGMPLSTEGVHEASPLLTAPLVVFSAMAVAMGVYAQPLIDFFTKVASGLI